MVIIASPPDDTALLDALDEQPDVLFELIPELDATRTWREPLASCSDCVLVAEKLSGQVDHAWAFARDTRCCTFHPSLPNYMAGRALARGGASARVIRKRLAERSGISAWGIEPSDSYRAVQRSSTVRFGRSVATRCPFWVGGNHACGVWRDRDAVCRTWFCKHEQGLVGTIRWTALRKLLGYAERRLAALLVDFGTPPETTGATSVAAWVAWFSWCAQRVRQLSADELSSLKDEKLSEARRRLANAIAADTLKLSDVVVPVIRGHRVDDGRLWMFGYSRYDVVAVDPTIVHFFARLDGNTTWREALRQSAASAHRITQETVHDLHRLDILQTPSRVLDRAVEDGMTLPPRDLDAPIPERLTPAIGQQIKADDMVWLQGAVPLGSLVAPSSIWWLFSRLDGDTRWRDVLAEMRIAHAHPIDDELIHALYRIGALQPDSP